MGKTIDIVSKIARTIVEDRGLILEDIEFVKEGNNWFLRVFVDNDDEVIGLDKCEEISKKISDELDRIDPIEQSYILEVSSPGLERPLKSLSHYDRFVGKFVKLKTFAPYDGKKEFIGTLLERDGDNIKIDVKAEGEKIIPFNKIASGQLIVDFGLQQGRK